MCVRVLVSYADSSHNALSSRCITMTRRRVVVTGLGVVSPLAVGAAATWARLVAGQSAVRWLTGADFEVRKRIGGDRPHPQTSCDLHALSRSHGTHTHIHSQGDGDATLASLPIRIAAPVDDVALAAAPWAPSADPAAYKPASLPPGHTRASLFALAAAAEAAAQAGWTGRGAAPLPYARDRVLVSLGVGMPSVTAAAGAGAALKAGGGTPPLDPSFLISRSLGATPAAAVSAWLGNAGGPIMVPSTACAAGASAIADAAAAIAAGTSDAALAGGAEAAIEPLTIAGFARMRALAAYGAGGDGDPSSASRPFDAGRAGFVLGEGAAVLVLEEAGAAAARGASPLALILGSGASGDAHHAAQPPACGSGAAVAMRRALAAAGLDPAAIAHVSAHATSTPAGDAAEAAALRAVFGGGGGAPAVSSIKGAVGHLLGAAGALEAAMVVSALVHGTAPPTLNLRAPDCGGDGGGSFTLVGPAPGGARLEPAGPGRPLAALSNSFGFGGANVCLAFQQRAGGVE